MNTLYLKYAVEVERTGSISQAAENLFMAQPNLSKAIKELETDLGIAIFERSSRGVHLTPKGREFLNYAENILEQLDKMEKLSKESESASQIFSVSIPRDSCILDGTARFFSGFDIEKEIDAAVCETSSIQTISNVSEGKFRLGIIRYRISFENCLLDYIAEKKLETMPLWEYKNVILISQDHFLKEKETLCRSDLDGLIEISYGYSTPTYLSVGKVQADNGARRRIVAYDRSSCFELLSEVRGTYTRSSPVSEKILKRYSLLQREFMDEIYADRLVFRKGYKLSETDKLFIENIYSAKIDVENSKK